MIHYFLGSGKRRTGTRDQLGVPACWRVLPCYTPRQEGDVRRLLDSAVLLVTLTIGPCNTPAVHGQTRTDAKADAFEVASVKPNPNEAPEGISLQPNGGVRFTAFHLRTLIALAYGSQTIQRFDQFVGGPAWLASDRFDIVAKAEGDISSDAQGRRSDRMPAMLRTLLEDRFHLRVHAETREMPAFALRLAHRDGTFGPQLHESSVECPRFVTGKPLPEVEPDRWCGIRAVGGIITGRGVPSSQIAGNLGGYPVVDRVVIDRTGLTGRYDFQIEYSPAFANTPDAPSNGGPSLFTALTEQLGLSLQPEKAVLPVIVIDHVEKPTPD
jgi:uncharacterized protein (TIGR03435 family)